MRYHTPRSRLVPNCVWRTRSLLLLGGVAGSIAVGCYTARSSSSAACSSAADREDEVASLLSPLARSGGAGDSAPSAAPATASTLSSLLSSRLVRVPVRRGLVDSIDVSCYNANPAIEDSYVVEPLLQFDPSNGCAVGVFDGHSGSAASIWLRRHILGFLQHHIRTGLSDQLLSPSAFQCADEHFINSSWLAGRPADGLSGACYNVVQLSGREIRCASAGDVRAILARRRTPSAETAAVSAARDGRPHSTHLAIPLSWDHQIDVNPGERDRLLVAHPNEADVIRRNRVKGRLQVLTSPTHATA